MLLHREHGSFIIHDVKVFVQNSAQFALVYLLQLITKKHVLHFDKSSRLIRPISSHSNLKDQFNSFFSFQLQWEV